MASEALVGANFELLQWFQKVEDVFNRLCRRFCGDRFYVRIYFVTLVFVPFVFEFPSGIRHLCTTMPWTIWPVLVVLWGVCWMFIQQEHGGVDKGSSLPLDQRLGQHVDTEGMYLVVSTLEGVRI
jgi:hypothetical protein